MEIIFKSNNEKSNFKYYSDLFKNKKPLNSFNKMLEPIVFEKVLSNQFNVRNVFFEERIQGTLYLCYPFNVVVKKNIEFDSLHSLISRIRSTYRKIYSEEKKTMTKCVKSNPFIINRGRSDGKYEIWGHEIGDLTIESIRIYEGNIIEVFIGS